MGTVEDLRNTKKGKLSYERCLDKARLKSLLEESPPGIRRPVKFAERPNVDVKEYEEKKDEEKKKISDVQSRARELKEHHMKKKQHQEAKVQEAEKTKQRLRAEAKRREEELQLHLQSIQKSLSDLTALDAKFQTMTSSFKYQQHLPEAAKKYINLIHTLTENCEKIVQHCKQTRAVTPENRQKIKEIIERAQTAYEFWKEGFAKQYQQMKQQQQQKQLKRQRSLYIKYQVPTGFPLALSTPIVVASQSPQSGASYGVVTSTAAAAAGTEKVELPCVDIRTFLEYTRLEEKLKSVEQKIQSLSATPQSKKLKFDFQKAVNIPINAISPVSGEHLRDKLLRLTSLLSGQPVEVGNKRISIRDHPDAQLFCRNLIARMIVKKGEEQVSSKHDTAFAIAMVTVGLWSEHPDLGELLLGHFYNMCPYILPCYIPRQEGQSSQEYFKTPPFVGLTTMSQDMSLDAHKKFLREQYSTSVHTVCELMPILVTGLGRSGDAEMVQMNFLSADREYEMSILSDPKIAVFYEDMNIQIVSFSDCSSLV